MEQSETIEIPYIVHESDMARFERRERRMFGVIALLIVALAGEVICRRFFLTTRTSE
jgi:hypothetical protein